ncbi:WxL domain-containing protein [Bacillus cereus]|uniref:WxL domain-containing protein n=1 Tax=Bacillus cereus TIAC219 TaxID=718222 RepID=A0ABC9SS05_BACCE|nr:WxL domain-containing protein [Bacillus cereus]EJP82953.1 hypothetical protein IC1_05724 [Bacillus cereus VD022]EOQ58651.1 hypothetical protein IAY_05838 [Bacillus cereus TIAC219]MCU5120115.1 WxL domain-containing protein [Bacillus cereus]MCU5633099.1 WxL domain-containing protein [Bacillus cereus]
MRKISLSLLALGTIILGSTSSIVNADTLNGESIASVNVKAGPLDLKSVDNISFGDVIINGKNQMINSIDNSTVSISDLRGSNDTGWALKVKKDNNKDGFKDKGLDLNFNPSTSASYVTLSGEMTINNEDQTVAKVSDINIKDTEFATNIDLNPKLNIAAKTFANAYSAKLVWNLAAGPDTDTN